MTSHLPYEHNQWLEDEVVTVTFSSYEIYNIIIIIIYQ